MNWFDEIEDSKNEQESYDVFDQENKILDREWHYAKDETQFEMFSTTCLQNKFDEPNNEQNNIPLNMQQQYHHQIISYNEQLISDFDEDNKILDHEWHWAKDDTQFEMFSTTCLQNKFDEPNNEQNNIPLNMQQQYHHQIITYNQQLKSDLKVNNFVETFFQWRLHPNATFKEWQQKLNPSCIVGDSQNIKQKAWNCYHFDKNNYSKGLCSSCYQKQGRLKFAWNCEHNTKSHHAKGLCKSCYQKKNIAKNKLKNKSD